jgi:hypothetical protein
MMQRHEEAERPAFGAGVSIAEVVTRRDAVAVVRVAGELCEVGLAIGAALQTGDRVLLASDDRGGGWIVGRCAAPLVDRILEDEEPLRLHDRQGRLLFEYDAASGRAVVHVPSGDLDVEVPDGAFRVRARDGISLAGAEITAVAERADLVADRLAVRARRVETAVERVKHVVGIVESTADRIVERAKDVYREVEGLTQLRSGRLRMVARSTAELVAENALMKARERMKIKGERIHLA